MSPAEMRAKIARLQKEEAALRAVAVKAAAEAASLGLSDSLENSLGEKLAIAQEGIKASGKVDGQVVPKELLDELLKKLAASEKDIGDLNFWEHGIVAPKKENEKYTKEEVGELMCEDGHGMVKVETVLAVLDEWTKAFNDLGRAYGCKALSEYAHKMAYGDKRNEQKNADIRIQSLEDSLARTGHAQIASESKVVEVEKKLRQVTQKPCGCKTFCAAAACGCKKSRVSCRDTCGCRCIDCCNPSSYDDTPEGKLLFREAYMNNIQRGEERVALRRESGH